MPRPRKQPPAPPRREGNPDLLTTIPKGAVVLRLCPECQTTFTPTYPQQLFCTYQHGQKFNQRRQRARGKLSQHEKWKLPATPKVEELVMVPKLITSEQVRRQEGSVPESLDVQYGTCSGCGGTVIQEGPYSFQYCGRPGCQ